MEFGLTCHPMCIIIAVHNNFHSIHMSRLNNISYIFLEFHINFPPIYMFEIYFMFWNQWYFILSKNHYNDDLGTRIPVMLSQDDLHKLLLSLLELKWWTSGLYLRLFNLTDGR